MTNVAFKVKTSRQPSGWTYRVVNGLDQTLVTRRGFATENKAREAGRAAAAALTPRPLSQRYSRPTETVGARPAISLQAPKTPSFLSKLFG
jgi:hypothetical protein